MKLSTLTMLRTIAKRKAMRLVGNTCNGLFLTIANCPRRRGQWKSDYLSSYLNLDIHARAKWGR